ncbi:helix-turn-helix transcriptional regulator [Marixanthomonas sp. SCSIO 43207]|uniref:winged helix-turn-helix transcriptional regulator n=1 Tax=Marixanthomonas sp. SCSIO 43207 TaxID=2779360 RepID=UPI001CA89E82|nr:helix-turn-helix domain-containing protein [Marixanthomonas sp. SCSIO 43207]UAB80936.1 helix-turn-helix transcriptional regulator [Marixanthomonas sp. SCSIO 43207]
MARKYINNPNACTLVHTMNIIGNKWKPIIIYLLSNGAMRFGKLNTLIPSISKKVLTDQLKEMESDGLLLRKSFAETPPRVEYSLTEKSIGLLPVLKLLSGWAETYYPEITFEQCRIIEKNNTIKVEQPTSE